MGRPLAIAFALITWSTPAYAQFPPVTDRGYALDLYTGVILGSTRVIGMGGANVAIAEGASGMSGNPASPANRPATSHDKWDWDFDLDWLNPQVGDDYDNNGVTTTDTTKPYMFSGALVGQRGPWGLGVRAAWQQVDVTLADGTKAQPKLQTVQLHIARILGDFTVGGGLRAGAFSLASVTENKLLFDLSGAGLEAGANWHPVGSSWRLGIAGGLPITGQAVTADCNPNACAGYILPRKVLVPWVMSAGVAWHHGPTPWNIQIPDRWRDERSLTIAADVVVTGAVHEGFGIEAFVDHQLQPSGRDVSVSIRGGANYEWLPGRLRVRGGGYWEPGRFDGVSGRMHATVGLDVRFYAFCFWSRRWRARLSLTADAARDYGNGAISLGLWH